MRKMFKLCFWNIVVSLVTVSAADLPSWITENPGYLNPVETDSIKTGNGTLTIKDGKSRGWLVYLNEKAGHGIELEVKKLILNPNYNDFLLISSWPLTADFTQTKMYTGVFKKGVKKIRIPNTKMFFVLYSASETTESPEMFLTYRRYGVALELNQIPTENPIKKKETIFEVQLKGKPPEEYLDEDFITRMKEGIRAAARRYSITNKIPFNEKIPTEKMVLIHRIAFCPFEWPDRHICASIKHSVFVSGIPVPEESIILDYQLTAEHLKNMWNEKDFPELQELGVIIFELPPTYSTVIYWMLIIGFMVISSLIGSFVFWKIHHTDDKRTEQKVGEQIEKIKKPKFKLAKHQRVPSFMYTNTDDIPTNRFKEPPLRSANEEILLRKEFENASKLENENSTQLPFKNYLGSILFNSNRAFEDDEDKPSEQSKTIL